MKPWAMLALGTAIGILVGAGVFLALGKASHPPPDWREVAQANTMPNRRGYTLPLNNPDMIPAEQANHMNDEDVVIGLLFHGKARAYPWWVTSNYHVVNDTVDEDPLLITLCEVCGGAAAFRPTLPDLPGISLSFQICSVGRGTIEIADHQTLSQWHPFLGSAFGGPLKGRSLERYPVLIMTWGEWKHLYPGGLVANGSLQLRERPHGSAAGHIGDPDLPRLFERTANLKDDRMGLHELVLGILIPETDKSYVVPVRDLVPFPNLFLVTLGKKPVLIVRQGELAMTAFDLEPTAYRTGLSLLSKAPIRFRSPDGLTWDVVGVSRTPEDREVRLPSVSGYLTEWYEWVSHSPQSEIVRSARILSETGVRAE
jgi:hypothetical protein